MDKDAIKKMMERGMTSEEIRKALEAQKAAELTAKTSAGTAPSPSSVPAKSPEEEFQTVENISVRGGLGYFSTIGRRGKYDMDRGFINVKKAFQVVMDELGTYNTGAADFISSFILDGLSGFNMRSSVEEAESFAKKLVLDTNRKLIDHLTELNKKSDHEIIQRTTLNFTKYFIDENGKNRILVANVGDSRTYVIRNGKIAFQTLDQRGPSNNRIKNSTLKTLTEKIFNEKRKTVPSFTMGKAEEAILLAAQTLNDLTDSTGKPKLPLDKKLDTPEKVAIVKEAMEKLGLTLDDWGDYNEDDVKAGFGFMRSIESSDNAAKGDLIGDQKLEKFQITTFEIEPGDLILTFTNGVDGNFTNEELFKIISDNDGNPAKITAAMKAAIDGGLNKKPDDVTVTVLEVEPELLEKITFTNEDLLKVLVVYKANSMSTKTGLKFSTGDISRDLKVDFNLAAKIIEYLKTRTFETKAGELITILKDDSKFSIEAFDLFEEELTADGKLDELFDLSSMSTIMTPLSPIIIPTAPLPSSTPTDPKKPDPIPDPFSTTLGGASGAPTIAPDSTAIDPLDNSAGPNPALIPKVGLMTDLLFKLRGYEKSAIKFGKKNRRWIEILLTTGIIAGAAALYNNKSPDEKINSSADITATAGKQAGGVKVTSLESVTQNYEKSEWWGKLRPDVQQIAKKILNAKDVKSYVMGYLDAVKFINSNDVNDPNNKVEVTINEKTKSGIYDSLNTLKTVLNNSSSGSSMTLVGEVFLDDGGKELREILLEKNLFNLANDLHLVNGQALGGNEREMFAPGTISEVVDSIKNQLAEKTKIQNN